MAVGRISGPLLKDNLLRDGVNLAFETDLLFLDVINGRVGVKTTTPTNELSVNGTTRTTNLQVTTQTLIGTGGNQFTISGNTIASSNGTINLIPSGANAVVYQAKLVLDDLQISTNTVEITTAGTDLNFETLGTGTVNVNNNMLVNGNIHATGNITADGDIQIGSVDQTGSNADTITFNAEILSDIIPDQDNTYDLGSISKTWRNVFSTNVTTTSVTVSDLTVNDTLDVSGIATFNGDVTLGTNSSNTVTFTSTIDSDLIPTTNNFYDIGTSALRWADSYFNRVEIDSLVIDNNTITTTANNDDLILSANGSGRIYIPSNNVQIDQALTVGGYTTLHGVSVTGDITQTGAVVQTGDYTQTGNATITGNLTVSTFGQFEKIRIDGNIISTTATDTDLQLEAAGTGKIYVPNDNVLISNNLTVNGTATINNLTVTTTITADALSTGDILIENNSITTTLTDNDLVLRANGSGIISIPGNNVNLEHDLTVGGNFTVTVGTSYLNNVEVTGSITQTGDIVQTGNFTTTGNTEVTGNITATGDISLAEISIIANTISTITSGTDLQLQANGTGNVVFEGLKVSDNTILSTATNSDITLAPQGTGNVIISSNQSLVIPTGSTSDRPLSPTNGMIRFNTDLDRYEGYSATYSTWLQLSGVEDADGNTYITAETTPGTNDNVLRFYVNTALMAYIDATKLWATRIETDQLAIYDNQITTVNTDTDINLTTSGTGGVKIGNLKINSNSITNVVPDAVTEFTESGTGYVKIAGANGVVIPSGTTGEQPTVPQAGMIRYNTYYQYVEVYDGSLGWINSAGTSAGISLLQATDLGIVSALLFG